MAWHSLQYGLGQIFVMDSILGSYSVPETYSPLPSLNPSKNVASEALAQHSPLTLVAAKTTLEIVQSQPLKFKKEVLW
jgi:hypothetical protein